MEETMNIVIAPDSYKGSLSSGEVADAIEKGIKDANKAVNVDKVPLADGGEGTVNAVIKACGGKKVNLKAKDPLGRETDTYYGIINNDTAIIEMAAISGLELLKNSERNPMKTTTYGTGELIKHAMSKGIRKIILGIGGSATNDGGMGMAKALGVIFRDKNGNVLSGTGSDLINIETIDTGLINKNIQKTSFLVLCDVVNPLCGKNGASFVYGKQKGATENMMERLDKGLLNFSEKIFTKTGIDIKNIKGAGAAGGLGGGAIAFLNSELISGVDYIIKIAKLEDKIKNADYVITGEGRTDKQTAFGKTVAGISGLAKKHNVPVICISGSLGDNISGLYKNGITAAFSIIDSPMSLDNAINNTARLLQKTTMNIIRLLT
jgi:glycerate kinase